MQLRALCIIWYPLVNSNWCYSPETANLGQTQRFFELCDIQAWQMTLKHNRAPLLCFVHLFNAISKFKLKLQSRNAQFRSKSMIFVFSCVTLKFYGWPWKTMGHLFYTTSCFVHHFVPIGEFKLELQSGNAQFGSKSTIFLAVWPWNLTNDLYAIGEFKLELQSRSAQFGSKSTILGECDLAIWLMTLKNNRAPLLCYFKLCATFQSHWWIQTGVTVQKCPIWVKINNFLAVWPWKLTDNLRKQ